MRRLMFGKEPAEEGMHVTMEHSAGIQQALNNEASPQHRNRPFPVKLLGHLGVTRSPFQEELSGLLTLSHLVLPTII